jgi:hypothetical protein
MRQRKQADVFALDTDEQDLTHHGRSIRDMERFDDINITDDETEEGTWNVNVVTLRNSTPRSLCGKFSVDYDDAGHNQLVCNYVCIFPS